MQRQSLEEKIQVGIEHSHAANRAFFAKQYHEARNLYSQACDIFEGILRAENHIDSKLLRKVRKLHLLACKQLAHYSSRPGIYPCDESYKIFEDALKIDPENKALLEEKGQFALCKIRITVISDVNRQHFDIAIGSFTSLLSQLDENSKNYVSLKIDRARTYSLLFAQQNALNLPFDESFYKALIELNEVSIRYKNNQNDDQICGIIKNIFWDFSEKALQALETTLSLEDELFLLTQLQDKKTVLGEQFDFVQERKIEDAASENKKYESLDSKVKNRIDTIWKKMELFKNTEKERNKNSFFYYMPPDIINLVQDKFTKDKPAKEITTNNNI